jgi:hypothetical protein
MFILAYKKELRQKIVEEILYSYMCTKIVNLTELYYKTNENVWRYVINVLLKLNTVLITEKESLSKFTHASFFFYSQILSALVTKHVERQNGFHLFWKKDSDSDFQNWG